MMSRWVEVDALIDDLEHDIAIDEDILDYVGTEGIQRATTQFDKDCKQNVIELLLRQPSIDIVRCGECKHREEYPCKVYHDDDWYCANGERKGSE